MSGKLSPETIRTELEARNITILEEIENYRTRKPFRCPQGHEWLCTAYDIIDRQHTCPDCGKAEFLNNHIIDEKVEELNRIRRESGGCRRHEAIKRIGDYVTHDYKIEWKCLCCDWEWLSKPFDILYRGVGCPLCHVKSETLVLLALKQFLPHIKFERQKFCCNYEYEGKTREARLDFYCKFKGFFPDGSWDWKEMAFEYNGKQHYDMVFFGSSVTQEQAEKKLAKQQYRDKVVRDYCDDNNIELFIIDGRKIHGEKKVYCWIKDLLKELGMIESSSSDLAA